MTVTELGIPDVKLLSPRVHYDERGLLLERWSAAAASALGIVGGFAQDNHSRSQFGVVRGLHFQTGRSAQGKLVGVVRGRILDVAVDVRPASPTFGKHVSVVLDDQQFCQLWVPAGFAHGFSVLSDVADVVYKLTSPYEPQSQAGVRFDDPALAIDWQLAGHSPILSAKDLALPVLAKVPLEELP